MVVNKDSLNFIKLEKHDTKDARDQHTNGTLTVVWRDWDEIITNHPKMVYVTSVNVGEMKGPHLHTQRNSYFVCIHGKVVFIVRDLDGKYTEIESSEDNPILIHVPKNYAAVHINLSSQISRVLTLADIAWKPNDSEMKNVSFDDYNWSKWDKIIN